MGKVLQFAKKVNGIEPKNPEQTAQAEQTLIESFAGSLRSAFTQKELDEIARELDEEPPTEED